jgi:hypothetical protein
MQAYWVEGFYIPAKGTKKSKRDKNYPTAEVELYARAVWANNPDDAVRLATEDLGQGVWKAAPRVSKKTEEKSMRAQGAPQLPGIDD